MKTDLKFLLLVFMVLFLSHSKVWAKIDFGVSIYGGTSNLKMVNKEYLYDSDGYRRKDEFGFSSLNYYTPGKSIGAELFVSETILKNKFTLEQGVLLESYEYYDCTDRIEFSDGQTMGGQKSLERYSSINIPIKIKYNYRNLQPFIGASALFSIDRYSDVGHVFNYEKFQVRGMIGVDWNFYRKFSVGVIYKRDITPIHQLSFAKVSYHYQIVQLKLSYRFLSRSLKMDI